MSSSKQLPRHVWFTRPFYFRLNQVFSAFTLLTSWCSGSPSSSETVQLVFKRCRKRIYDRDCHKTTLTSNDNGNLNLSTVTWVVDCTMFHTSRGATGNGNQSAIICVNSSHITKPSAYFKSWEVLPTCRRVNPPLHYGTSWLDELEIRKFNTVRIVWWNWKLINSEWPEKYQPSNCGGFHHFSSSGFHS